MTLETRFLSAAALSTTLLLIGCGDNNDNEAKNDNNMTLVTQSAVDITQISTGDIVSSLENGLHKITIPATLSGEKVDKTHVWIKQQLGEKGYLLNLGTFPSELETSSTEVVVETIEHGEFINVLEDGIHQLKVDGKAFPDKQDRTFSIVKERLGEKGFATVLSSSLTNDLE